jgi:transcriptional regulator with XRE-family HTH domain
MITQAELVALLREQAQPSQQAYAQRIGIHQSYLSDVLNGRRDPGKTILAALGYERVVLYRKIDKQ